MKTKLFMLSIIALLCFSGIALGEREHDHSAHKMAMPEKTAAAVEVGNELCPVTGEKVGAMGPAIQYEHNGKIYNLCCAGCVEEFKANPEKYSKIAEENVVAEHGTSDHPM